MPKHNRKKIHRRGGSYLLRIMTDVTDWGGTLLDRQILNNLQVGDIVRVIFEDYGAPRYIEITNLLSNHYFKGFINDPYHNRYCDICMEESRRKDPLHECQNPNCEFDCHMSCLSKNLTKKCSCDISVYKIVKHEQYLLNGSTIIFRKNNISEIPNWSNNTCKQIKYYSHKDNTGV